MMHGQKNIKLFPKLFTVTVMRVLNHDEGYISGDKFIKIVKAYDYWDRSL